MRKHLWLGLVCLMFWAAPSIAAKLVVAVSLQPYANVVREIGGDKVDVVALLPPGADPHTFEPKPASLKDFSRATVYFSDGSGMDAAWLPRFKGVNKNVTVISLSKGIQWMAEDELHHHEHAAEHKSVESNAGNGAADHGTAGHDDGDDELDPHLWTSPVQMALVAKNVLDALVQQDAANAEHYRTRAETLLNRLKNLNGELLEMISSMPAQERTFIVFHPSYGYFARDYGMKQLTVEVDGKEPKPRDLMNLVKTGKDHNVHIVFVQLQFSKRAAATIAKELNAKIVVTDPLAYDYEANIRALLTTLKTAP